MTVCRKACKTSSGSSFPSFMDVSFKMGVSPLGQKSALAM